MIKIENVDVSGWEAAIRGMRNPMNSWDKSDSFIPCYVKTKCHECEVNQKCSYYCASGEPGKPYKKNEFIGTNDLDLMKRLANAGTDHRKFLRMINVTMDITAPLYWWKEFDTYKVGTVANSCSTMHKIAEKEFTLDDFSCEHLITQAKDKFKNIVDALNGYRDIFVNWEKQDELIQRAFEYNKKQVWWQMIQLLPSSYNQRRTVLLNYEVLANIYKSRKNHKLNEWSVGFIDWIKSLPYSELITGEEN